MKRCLVIDDSPVVRKLARRMLERLGLKCVEARDGRSGLAVCDAVMPDGVLVDGDAPAPGGVAFLEQLRARPRGDEPVIVYCTSESDLAHISRALRAGADECILKPFDSATLRSKLSHAGLV